MDRDSINQTLRRMLVNDLFIEKPEEQIGVDDDLRTVIGLDSIGFSEIRILSERKFDIEIADDDFNRDNFSTIRRVTSLIMRIKGLSH